MKNKNKKNIFLMLLGKPQGFSLVEIMVAAGMLGVVSLGVMQMTSNMNKSNKKIKQDFEAQSLLNNIAKQITDTQACANTLNGVRMNGDDSFSDVANGIRDRDNNNVANPQDLLGQTSGALIHIESIQARGYRKSDGTYGNTLNDHFFNETVTIGGVTNTYKRGQAEIRVIFRKGPLAMSPTFGTPTPAQLLEFQKRYVGGVSFQRSFFVTVLADSATNDVVSCYGDQQQYAEAACGMINGYMVAGQCVNPTIANDSTVTHGNAPSGGDSLGSFPGPESNEYAMQAIGNVTIRPNGGGNYGGALTNSGAGSFSLGIRPNDNSSSNFDVMGSVGIGAAAINAPISDTANPGNLDVYNGVAIHGLGGTPMGLSVGLVDPVAGQGNVQMTGALGVGSALPSVAGDARINNRLSVGAINPGGVAGDAQIQNNLSAGGGLLVGGGIHGFAAGEAAISSKLSVGASDLTGVGAGSLKVAQSVGVGANSPAGTGNLHVNNSLSVGSVAANPNTNGQVQVGANINIGIGDQIQITGMPDFRTDIGAAATLPSPTNRQVPTKQWVVEAVSHFFSSEADTAQIFSTLVGYASSQPMEGLESVICNDFRVTIDGTTNSGSWDGSKCNINSTFTACGDSSGDRCATHYTNNYNATGSVTAGSVTTSGSGNITAGGNLYGTRLYASSHADVGGRLLVSSYGQFNNYVRGTRFCINGSTANVHCITKARSDCGGGGRYAIGWYNGHLQCQAVSVAGW